MHSDKLFQKLFGPLDRGYCTYYLALSIISMVIASLIVGGFIIQSIAKGKVDMNKMTTAFSVSLNFFVLYFANRLLHTMCVRSL